MRSAPGSVAFGGRMQPVWLWGAADEDGNIALDFLNMDADHPRAAAELEARITKHIRAGSKVLPVLFR